MKSLVRLLVLGLAFGLAASKAAAGLLPVSVTVLPDGNNYRWTYNIILPTDSQLRNGDYFTIYNFGGYIEGSNSQPTDWEYSVSNRGPIPEGVDPIDNPDLPNLTWRYTGPTIVSGSASLGNFWALSLYSESTESFFVGRTHRTSDGVIDTNITDTTVPVPTGPNTVPEPATIALALLGLPAAGLARRYRRQS